MPRIIVFRVKGVTYENRQEKLAKLKGNEPCRIVPEPTNLYDKNALMVVVAVGGDVWHIGYVPKEEAAKIAPYLEGESFDATLLEITGGFETDSGESAYLGARVKVSFPDEMIQPKV